MRRKFAALLALSIVLTSQTVSAADNKKYTGGGATTVSYECHKETYVEAGVYDSSLSGAPRTGVYDSSLSEYLFTFSAAGLMLFVLLYIREKEKEKEEAAVD